MSVSIKELKPAEVTPAYYGGKENTYEAIKVIAAWKLNFCLGNVLKYVSRCGKKDPAKKIEDLKKAVWYLEAEIENLEANVNEQTK